MQDTKLTSPDELLVDIARRARRYAQSIVAPDIAEDLAHEVVLELLPRVRAGTLALRAGALAAMVRSVVRRRAVDWLRRTQRRVRRHLEREREVAESVHAWMSPDIALEEARLVALHREMLDSLPAQCRRAYTMVREEESTYKVVACELGLSEHTVRLHVVHAQQRLRVTLYKEGVMAESGATGPGHRGRSKKSQGKHDLHAKPRGAR